MNPNTKFSIISAAVAFAVALSGPAFAQATDPDHPRVNEIQGRIDNQENRINQGIGQGQINGKQAARDEPATLAWNVNCSGTRRSTAGTSPSVSRLS